MVCKKIVTFEEDRMLLVALFSYSDQAFHTQTFCGQDLNFHSYVYSTKFTLSQMLLVTI